MRRLTPNLRTALVKAAVVLVPSYGMAWFTGAMVYVVPTLAAAGFLAAAVEDRDVARMLDEDGPDTDDDGVDGDAGTDLPATDWPDGA